VTTAARSYCQPHKRISWLVNVDDFSRNTTNRSWVNSPDAHGQTVDNRVLPVSRSLQIIQDGLVKEYVYWLWRW